MALHKPTTYLFVDGSNFRQYFNESTTKWFGQEVEFDFQKIKDAFQAEKAFYYDCIDDIKNDNETQNECDLRAKLQEEKLNKIREVEGCHVHLGSISGKNKKKRQKEVDVMLAVQMMEHAFRGNMQKAVLLSGDKDFRPLVESLVRLGLFVEVVGDKNHISQDLIHSADSSQRLDIDKYVEWSVGLIVYQNQLPTKINYIYKKNLNNLPQKVKSCVVNNMSIEIYHCTVSIDLSGNEFMEEFFVAKFEDLTGNRKAFYAKHTDSSRLELFSELKYGKIDWK